MLKCLFILLHVRVIVRVLVIFSVKVSRKLDNILYVSKLLSREHYINVICLKKHQKFIIDTLVEKTNINTYLLFLLKEYVV